MQTNIGTLYYQQDPLPSENARNSNNNQRGPSAHNRSFSNNNKNDPSSL